MPIKQGTILECDKLGPHGKPVVAVIGYASDFAVYEQSYPEQVTPSLIAANGDKVYIEHAKDLFPELFKSLRYRS